jgi:hypothetical protein
MAKIKCLGTKVTNDNDIDEEIKSTGRLNSLNACYHIVQNSLSSRLQSKM